MIFAANVRSHPRLLSVGACLAIAIAMAIWSGLAGAQEAPDAASVSARFAQWNRTLERISRDINGLKLDAAQIELLSEQTADIRSQALEFGSGLQGFAAEARELRDAFIATIPPGITESPESQVQSKELRDRVGLFEGWVRQVDLTVARTDQLLDKISTKRLNQLAASLTERGPVPLIPLVWARAAEEAWSMAGLATSGILDEIASWSRHDKDYGVVALTVLTVAVLFGMAMRFVVRLVERQSWPVLGPTLNGPASRTMLMVLRSAAPWFAAVAVVGFFAPLKDWLPELAGRTVIVALIVAGLTLASGIWILRATVSQPPDGAPSLVPEGVSRLILMRSLTILVILCALDTAIQRMTEVFVSANLLAVWAVAWSVGGTFVARRAVQLIRQILLRHDSTNGTLARLILLLIPPAVAVVSVLASSLGYAQLGTYVFANSMVTALILYLAWAFRLLAQEVLVRAGDPEGPAAHRMQASLGTDQTALRLAQFWLGIVCDIAIVLGTLVALMVTWGTGTEDALLMLERLIEGVRIGNITLSLVDLIAAMTIFAIGVWITRLAQRILDRRVFPGTQLDPGVRNSLRSGLGYVGVIIAGTIAIFALGINLSGLALVAGALSVGIGFGLQNIINNFVSGLILLIERPVKVGDWITVGSNEGLVNRINVRSTEIITDSRASVLIPNADFLSASVTNWTFKDRFARLHLTFQLPESLGADGGRELLLACAKGNANVQSDPPPRVLLEAIGGTYTFSMAADVADVTMMKEVASELRFAVDHELRKRPA